MTCGPVVPKCLAGNVRTSGHSGGTYEVSCLEHLGIEGVSSSRAKVCKDVCSSFSSAFSIKIVPNYTEINEIKP